MPWRNGERAHLQFTDVENNSWSSYILSFDKIFGKTFNDYYTHGVLFNYFRHNLRRGGAAQTSGCTPAHRAEAVPQLAKYYLAFAELILTFKYPNTMRLLFNLKSRMLKCKISPLADWALSSERVLCWSPTPTTIAEWIMISLFKYDNVITSPSFCSGRL